MSDLLMDSREIERMLDIKPSTLRWLSANLGSTHGRKGVARKWTLGDLTLLVIAQRLADRGFTNKAAVALARSLTEPQWIRLVADDNARLWLVAFPTGAESFEAHLCEIHSDVLGLVEQGKDAVVIDLRVMLEDAFVLVQNARKGSER